MCEQRAERICLHIHSANAVAADRILAAASYPFVDLPSGDTLRCKLFPADKFYKISLYFDGRVKYNEVNGKAEVDCEKFYIARRK